MANTTHSVGWKSAKKNYPKYWTKDMLRNLVEHGKLYDWEFEEITGQPY